MILITGGARSGKSQLAEKMAETRATQRDKPVLYIATSLITDAEMAERVAIHQRQRPSHWRTHEGYRQLGEVIRRENPNHSAIVLECITTMLTNLLFDQAGDLPPELMDFEVIERALVRQVDDLLAACAESHCETILVTNELGFGVVPESLLGRRFRDISGRINQLLAQQANEVHLVISGIDMKIKG